MSKVNHSQEFFEEFPDNEYSPLIFGDEIPPKPEPDGWLTIHFNAQPGREYMYLFKEMTHWKYRPETPVTDDWGLGTYPPGLVISFTPEAAKARRCNRIQIPWSSIMSMQVKENSPEVIAARKQWIQQHGKDI